MSTVAFVATVAFVTRAPLFRPAAVVQPRVPAHHVAKEVFAEETTVGSFASGKDIKEVFAEVDSDGSGAISGEELTKLMQSSGLSLTPSQIQAILLTVDKDGDGEISFEEFESAFDLGSAVTKEGLAATLRLKGANEMQRPFRRTVYAHDDWVQHRSNKRFARNFLTTYESGFTRSLKDQISGMAAVATFVVLVNCALTGYTDFAGVAHPAPLPVPMIKSFALPPLPFTILGPALSLLLVFRTNTAYFRWNEARTLWGAIINTCRNIQRQSNAFFDEDEYAQELRAQLALQVAAFPKALRSFLRGVEDDPIFRKDAIQLLGPETAEAIMVSKNRPTFVCNLMSATVQRAALNPIDRSQIDQNVNKLVDYLGACERIFKSPIPLVYTRLTSRFISWYVLFSPLALWGALGDSWNHWATIPATVIITTFLLGIEELGMQIEEPFGILPLEAMADGSIEGVVVDMRSSYLKGHFGSITPGAKFGKDWTSKDPEAAPAAPAPAPAATESAANSASLLDGASLTDNGDEVEPGGYILSKDSPGWMKNMLSDEEEEGAELAAASGVQVDSPDWFKKFRRK